MYNSYLGCYKRCEHVRELWSKYFEEMSDFVLLTLRSECRGMVLNSQAKYVWFLVSLPNEYLHSLQVYLN